MRIRTAIFTVYVAASAVGLAVLMRYVLAEVRPRYIAAIQHNLDDAARLLAAAYGERPSAFIGWRAAPSGLRMRVIAADGTILFDTDEVAKPGASESRGPSAPRDVVEGPEPGLIETGTVEGEREVSASVPVERSGVEIGRLVLSRPIRSVNEVIWSERKKLAGIALAVAGVMLAAGWWIAARLTKSIERLTAYVQGLRDGRSTAPPQSRAIEIAGLTRSFEEMRETLEGRRHAERYIQALAHEVKAPLTAIRGAAELMEEDMPEDRRRRFLANIRGESARIQRIVERLLELTSIEARRTLTQLEPIETTGLLEEAADSVRAAYAVAGVTLTVVDEVKAQLVGERFLLRQALVNLLQNALDFSPSGGEVTLQVVSACARLDFIVEDRGSGVPDYALSQVFDRFYSLPRPRDERRSTGIGLALVREIARLHGGDATLENRSGGGVRAMLWVTVISAA